MHPRPLNHRTCPLKMPTSFWVLKNLDFRTKSDVKKNVSNETWNRSHKTSYGYSIIEINRWFVRRKSLSAPNRCMSAEKGNPANNGGDLENTKGVPEWLPDRHSSDVGHNPCWKMLRCASWKPCPLKLDPCPLKIPRLTARALYLYKSIRQTLEDVELSWIRNLSGQRLCAESLSAKIGLVR